MSDTLLARLESLAARDPAAPFLADGPGKEGWCGAPPRSFSRAQALAAVEALAARWSRLGLAPGDGVGLALPAVAEAYVAVLACSAADLVPVLLPLHLDEQALTARVRRLTPAALVTCTRLGDYAPAEALAAVAAGAFSVRHVMAFGPPGQPGLIQLDATLTRAALNRPERGRDAAEAIKAPSRGPTGESLVADGRELLAAGGRLARATGAGSGDVIVATPLPSSLEGLAGTLGLALAAGAQLVPLGLPRLQDLRAALGTLRPTHLVLPEEAARNCAAAGLAGSASTVLLARDGGMARALARRVPGSGAAITLDSWEENARSVVVREAARAHQHSVAA